MGGQFTVRNFDRQSPYVNRPGSRWPPEPEGTISGLIEVIDPASNTRMAICHRLLRPDGTYGASGYPDPKMVLIEGTIYIQRRKEGRSPLDAKLPFQRSRK